MLRKMKGKEIFITLPSSKLTKKTMNNLYRAWRSALKSNFSTIRPSRQNRQIGNRSKGKHRNWRQTCTQLHIILGYRMRSKIVSGWSTCRLVRTKNKSNRHYSIFQRHFTVSNLVQRRRTFAIKLVRWVRFVTGKWFLTSVFPNRKRLKNISRRSPTLKWAKSYNFRTALETIYRKDSI